MVQSRKKIMKQRQEIKRSWAGRRNFPANIYFFKVTTETLGKCVKYVQS